MAVISVDSSVLLSRFGSFFPGFEAFLADSFPLALALTIFYAKTRTSGTKYQIVLKTTQNLCRWLGAKTSLTQLSCVLGWLHCSAVAPLCALHTAF